MWQVATHIGIGVVAAVLTRAPLGPLGWRIGTAMAIAGVVLAGFFLTAATMRFYGGELADPNGYQSLAAVLADIGHGSIADITALLSQQGMADLRGLVEFDDTARRDLIDQIALTAVSGPIDLDTVSWLPTMARPPKIVEGSPSTMTCLPSSRRGE